jgi:hypothetical protein
MRNEILRISGIIIVIIGIYLAITYAIILTIGVGYVLDLTYRISNLTEPRMIDFLPFLILDNRVAIPLPTSITLHQLTYIYVIIYIIFFSLSVTREKNIIEVIKERDVMENDFLATFSYMSLTLIAILIIDLIQTSAGIETGQLNSPDDYTLFVTSAIAPFIEEIAFRLVILGLASLIIYLLIYGRRSSKRDILYAIWKPYKLYKYGRLPYIYIKILYLLVLVGGLYFGLTHFLSNSGWRIGKITTAGIAGIVLGYLYVKHGFHSSVIGHTFFNIYLFSLDYVGNYYMRKSMWTQLQAINITIYIILAMGAVTSIYLALEIITPRETPQEPPPILSNS